MLNFVRFFFHIYCDDQVIFSFILLIRWIPWIDFRMLNQICVFGTNLTWSWLGILFTYCYIWFAKIVLRILHLCSWGYWFIILFKYLCLILVSDIYANLIKRSWEDFLLLFSRRVFVPLVLFLMCLVDSTSEVIWVWS